MGEEGWDGREGGSKGWGVEGRRVVGGVRKEGKWNEGEARAKEKAEGRAGEKVGRVNEGGGNEGEDSGEVRSYRAWLLHPLLKSANLLCGVGSLHSLLSPSLDHKSLKAIGKPSISKTNCGGNIQGLYYFTSYTTVY